MVGYLKFLEPKNTAVNNLLFDIINETKRLAAIAKTIPLMFGKKPKK